MPRIAAVLALAVLVAAGALAQTRIDYDKALDFTAYKTYAWRAGTPDPDAGRDAKVRAAIDTELAACGFERRDEGETDLVVTYHAPLRKRLDLDDEGNPRRWTRADKEIRAVEFSDRTLIVHLLEAKSGRAVWRGATGQALLDDPQKFDKRLQRSVRRLFKKFPTKRDE